MGKIYYRPVFDRKKKLDAQGKGLLQVEAYLSGRRAYFSTDIYLDPRQWNEKKCRIVRHPEADALNYMLRAFMMDLEHKELELWRKGVDVTLEDLKSTPEPDTGQSFIQFVAEDISGAPKKESTRKNLMSTQKLLERFSPTLGFEEVDAGLLCKFEEFLYRSGCSTNTVAKHLKHLRSFVNSAIAKGYMKADHYAFQRYRIKTSESKHTHLLPEEVRKLECLELPYRRMALCHSLDAFLFCCYTGLRYSDFVTLTEKNVMMLEGNPWISFRSVKTDMAVMLPLHLLFEGKAWDLLRKYKNNWNAFFALKPNAVVNRNLKSIGELAGIEKHFTFHAARHTNATLLLYQGASITTVQKLLGHRNISTTQVYGEVLGETIVKDLAKIRG